MMAHVAFPATLRPYVQSSTLHVNTPVDLLQAVDGTTQAIRRSRGGWKGVLTLRSVGKTNTAILAQVRAFLASVEGRLHTFDVPMPSLRGKFIADTPPTLTLGGAITISGGLAVFDVNGATKGLLAGQAVTFGGQLYVLQTDMASGEFKALPQRPGGSDGDVVEWQYPTQKARRTERDVEIGRTSLSMNGPWAIEWESAI